MNRFFRKCFEPLKYGAAVVAGGLYVWALTLLAKDDNWVGISALTTMLLAIAAFWAIWQNHSLQKRERKERLLNEIIDWATDIAKCGLEKEFKHVSVQFDKDDPRSDRFVSAFFIELARNFEAMGGRSQYIRTIALKFKESLQKAVKELIETVEEHIDLLDECKVGQPGELEKAIGNVRAHNTPLRESARKIIEEAAKIKSEEIGREEENMSKEGKAAEGNEPSMKDIEEHLKQQDRQMARTQWQWLFILGVSAMAVGLTWIIATTPITQGDFKSGLFVFSIGVLIALLSLFYRYRKKS